MAAQVHPYRVDFCGHSKERRWQTSNAQDSKPWKCGGSTHPPRQSSWSVGTRRRGSPTTFPRDTGSPWGKLGPGRLPVPTFHGLDTFSTRACSVEVCTAGSHPASDGALPSSSTIFSHCRESQCSAWSHKPRSAGATPAPASLSCGGSSLKTRAWL